MAISAFDFFKLYIGIKIHFNGDYDFFKYTGRVKKLDKEIFDNRNDKSKFETVSDNISSGKHALEFCVFNFINKNDWLYDSFDESNEIYLKKKSFYDAMSFHLKKDNEYIKGLLDAKNISITDTISNGKSGSKPILLQAMLSNRISTEFICLLDAKFDFLSNWQNSFLTDPLAGKAIQITQRYKPFVEFLSKHN